jgi:hypothetical protein
MKSEPRLTVEFDGGSRVDQYRIRQRRVEFRPRSRGDSRPNDGWRRLTSGDILMHFALHTVVGEWLSVRLHQSVLRRMRFPRQALELLKAA